MIDINKLNELEKEVRDLKDTILKQVWLVHHIVGVDFNSDTAALIEIDEVYEQRGDYTECKKSHCWDWLSNKLYQSTVFIKRELFDMTEEELRANKERLSNELEETNKIQRNARLNTIIAYDSMCRLRKNGECNK